MPTTLRKSKLPGKRLVPEHGAMMSLSEIDDNMALPYTEKEKPKP